MNGLKLSVDWDGQENLSLSCELWVGTNDFNTKKNFLVRSNPGILRNPDSDPDSDSNKIRTRVKPGPGLEQNPDSCLKKPGLDF
jgi:hypothetical protein